MIILDYTLPNIAWNESFRRQKSKRKETERREGLINRNQTPINILSSHKLKIYESLKKQISSWDRIEGGLRQTTEKKQYWESRRINFDLFYCFGQVSFTTKISHWYLQKSSERWFICDCFNIGYIFLLYK